MNIFGFGRGDFFGTIIPGAFLVANLCLCLHLMSDGAAFPTILKQEQNASVILIPLLAVASYVFGLALRLVSPDLTEWISAIFRGQNPLSATFEKFPYVDSFYKEHVPKSPKSYRIFFDDLKTSEFEKENRKDEENKLNKADEDPMNKKSFFNQCRFYVMLSAPELRQEVLHAEGLSRFVCGMILALFPSIFFPILWFFESPSLARFFPILAYVFLFFVFVVRLPNVRKLEAYNAFNFFAMIRMRESQTIPTKPDGASKVEKTAATTRVMAARICRGG